MTEFTPAPSWRSSRMMQVQGLPSQQRRPQPHRPRAPGGASGTAHPSQPHGHGSHGHGSRGHGSHGHRTALMVWAASQDKERVRTGRETDRLYVDTLTSLALTSRLAGRAVRWQKEVVRALPPVATLPGKCSGKHTRRHSDGAWARGRKQPRPRTREKIALSSEDTVEL